MSDLPPPSTEFHAAKLKYMAEVPKLVRDATADMELKSGRHATYDYATQAASFGVGLPALAAHGFAFNEFTTVVDGWIWLVAQLVLAADGTGQEARLPVAPFDAPAQRWGSALTYSKRQALLLLGLLSAEDDDGGAASAPQPKRGRAPVRQAAAPAAVSDALDAALADNAARAAGNGQARKPATLSQRLAVVSSKPAFWRWIEEVHGASVSDESEAAEWTRQRYRITSRAALDTESDAAVQARDDLADFELWMRG